MADRRGRPTGHVPANRGTPMPGTKKPARTSSRVVRALFDLIDASNLSLASAGSPAGLHYVTLSRWKHGHASPLLVEFENVVQGMGCRLAIVPDYPEGDVAGPCICGSWPGGRCLKCTHLGLAALEDKAR